MNRHALHASLLVITLCVSVGAQDAAIVTGSVTDAETGRPLVGANVVVVSQGEAVLGAVSRVDGRYTVRGVPPGTYTVTASHIGFGVHTKKEVVVGKGALVELAFALMEAELQLNPVTVTASPRSERLMDAPAEIGVLEKEEIQSRPVPSVADHLQGTQGVDILTLGVNAHRVVVRGFNSATTN